MINKPKIILLDEPYANLDPQLFKIFKNIFLKFNHESSVVITDHNLKNLFDTQIQIM